MAIDWYDEISRAPKAISILRIDRCMCNLLIFLDLGKNKIRCWFAILHYLPFLSQGLFRLLLLLCCFYLVLLHTDVASLLPWKVSNTEGQVYSLYIRSPHFRWIQDYSSIDKMINIISGNNGYLYLIFPRKAIVMSLDVSTGNMSWQSSVGPLSTETITPVVDSNGKTTNNLAQNFTEFRLLEIRL